jgi:putative transposase
MYQVRRVNIGKTGQLDELARECGRLYSQTLVSFWRTVRHKGIWLKPKHLMRWYTSEKLHAHTADACVQAFFASLNSWRVRRKSDPLAAPPWKRKWYFRIEYKSSALHHKDGVLTLSNGKGNAPLVLKWPWQTPKTVVIRWTGTQYEAVATYKIMGQGLPRGDRVAGIDLGEIHMAVSYDGEQTHILNGRLLRSKRQYQNKLKAKLSCLIDVKKRGSRRGKRLARSKQKQLKKIKSQIKDVEHKQTTRLISTLHTQGVQTVVIGDVREIRQDNDTGSTNNQRIHQWSFGSVRHKLTYKAERLGMKVVLEDEYHTSRTCPKCGHVRKSRPQGREFRCTNRLCRWVWHRDGVGAYNIRQKYRGEFGSPHVVADMAPATGMRFAPHTCVARSQGRETVSMGNCAGAAGL